MELADDVAALVRADAAGALDAKQIRAQLEKRLKLAPGSLRERKREIARLIDAARSAGGTGTSASAPRLARLVVISDPGAPRALFCDACGSLLEDPTHTNTEVSCGLCGQTVAARDFQSLVVCTVGKEHVLGASEHAQKVQRKRARAVVREACPECAHPELQYYTMQLRSADEGQTVFYECGECGHTYSTNT
jgi:DNA-directed RNA polymerase I subunit RPA12